MYVLYWVEDPWSRSIYATDRHTSISCGSTRRAVRISWTLWRPKVSWGQRSKRGSRNPEWWVGTSGSSDKGLGKSQCRNLVIINEKLTRGWGWGVGVRRQADDGGRAGEEAEMRDEWVELLIGQLVKTSAICDGELVQRSLWVMRERLGQRRTKREYHMDQSADNSRHGMCIIDINIIFHNLRWKRNSK